MSRLPLFICLFFGLVSLGARSTSPAIQTQILPLEAIERGMEGTWRTVVAGTEIETFHFKVLGVDPNFAGPGQPVILAEATDASQILSGPVGGMSGSPCYIDGKLIGAYAYGYTWPKEQAIIGITPIEEMFRVLDMAAGEDSAGGRGGSSPGAMAIDDLPRPSRRFAPPDGGVGETLPPGKPGNLAAGLVPAPTPLLAPGLPERVLAPFRPYAEAMGFSLMSAPVGGAADLTAADLQAGSPAAGILLDGDFGFVGVGTCTWREGDRVLAFGHPFLQSGPSDMPLAPAEVITVVRSLSRSFKLANVGPIVGALTQDRLTAIAGEIGREPKTTAFTVNVKAGGQAHAYTGNLFRDENLSPLIGVLGFIQGTMSTLEAAENQSYLVTARADYAGYEPVEMTFAGDGLWGVFQVAFEMWDLLGMVAMNPFERAQLEALTFDVTVEERREQAVMDRLQWLSGSARPGEALEVAVGLRGFRDEAWREVVRVPVPAAAAGETLSLLVGDAAAADRVDQSWQRTVASLGELLDYFRERRANDRVYVKLLRRAPGFRIEGQALDDLPPSARALLDSPRSVLPVDATGETTLWETSLQTPGAFSGSHRFTVPVQPR